MNTRLVILLVFVIFVLSYRKKIEEFREGSESFKQKNVIPDNRDEAIELLIN